MSKFHVLTNCPICDREITKQSLKAHIAKHNAQPKYKCQHCGTETNNERFCSHSCAATYNNLQRPKKIYPKKKSRTQKCLEDFLEGRIADRNSLRKYLRAQNGYHCAICNLDSWMDQPITLIVDHEDGNAGNNHPDNLRLLCPNCNSQTPTFGGRNKGNGRKARGLPLN